MGTFGSRCPELQKFAAQILSQTFSASWCEHNWNVFEHMHTKKRNRLEKKWLNDRAFVHHNLRLRHNQFLNKALESNTILLDDFDSSSDWVVETQPIAFDNEYLSWFALAPLPHQYDVNIDVGQFSFG